MFIMVSMVTARSRGRIKQTLGINGFKINICHHRYGELGNVYLTFMYRLSSVSTL